MLVEAVLTSTHNLCFGAKIRKIGIPLIPQFCYIKVGFEGVYITRTCFPIVEVQTDFCMNYNYNLTVITISNLNHDKNFSDCQIIKEKKRT